MMQTIMLAAPLGGAVVHGLEDRVHATEAVEPGEVVVVQGPGGDRYLEIMMDWSKATRRQAGQMPWEDFVRRGTIGRAEVIGCQQAINGWDVSVRPAKKQDAA